MNNYIKFEIENDRLIAKIHKFGIIKKYTNPKDVNYLIKLYEKYGYRINGECTIEDYVIAVSREFEEYIEKRKNDKLKLLNEVKPEMKIKRKSKVGKIIVTTALLTAGIVGIASYISNRKENKNSDTEIEYEINYSTPEIDTTTEDISYSSNTIEPTTEEIIEEETKEDLDNMLKSNEFYYTCDREVYPQCIEATKQYDDIFEKYANDYGVDKVLQEAKAAAETGGDHYGNLDGDPAYGIMQIEGILVKEGSYVDAYNFRTKEVDRVYLTEENVKDLETNIQIACMFSQEAFKNNDYNIILGTQQYNMGGQSIKTILNTCSEIENIPKEELINGDNKWLDYRAFVGIGDPEYVEHCFRYIPEGYTIKIRRIDNGEYETLTPHNEYQKEKEL